jgi:hypothetical protein
MISRFIRSGEITALVRNGLYSVNHAGMSAKRKGPPSPAAPRLWSHPGGIEAARTIDQ